MLGWFSTEILLSESLKVLDWFSAEILLSEARGTLILGKTQETITVDYVSDSQAQGGRGWCGGGGVGGLPFRRH